MKIEQLGGSLDVLDNTLFFSYGRSSLQFLILLLALLILPAVLLAEDKPRSYSTVVSIEKGEIYGGELVIPVNKSQFLKIHLPYKELSIGNPDIADVVALSSRSLYILGKQIGSTNLTVRDEEGNVVTVIDIVVSYDIEALKKKLFELSPGDVIEVRPAGPSIVLGGQVSSSDRLHQIVSIAEQYAPGKVINMLSVYGSQQVLLKVRFAEVKRTVLKDIGFTNIFNLNSGSDSFTVSSGDGVNPGSFVSAVANVISGDFTLTSTVDMLESKGFIRTLAEPNIIALSGNNASFLAGGEFPIPVSQDSDAGGGSAITVEFKEFGVGLSFTPTVVGKDIINLVLEAEVSAIDPTVSVTTGSIVIPGLKVRRASTTVELIDGQSFAIAGLIEDNFADLVRAIPGLGDIPIIGALARSTDFMSNQTELVIIIQVHLVQPVTERALSLPTDHALPPSEFDLFMMGQIEEKAVISQAAGIDGPYGYILP
ncbi:MAG: hypothetical protein COA45_03125 [Zetaproteobacteria bacterium]|nr:MAG: hypothetical protein COA45_03125 [Zetaproteobacteria bacterium]